MSDPIGFAKYQAAGNDFILFDDLGDGRAVSPAAARALCDRRFGVGADGVIRITRGGGAPFAMHLTNSDGSTADMSGNGLRCLGAYLREEGSIDGKDVDVETPAGVRHVALELDGDRVLGATVSMGFPSYLRAEIPMLGPAGETFLGQRMDIGEGLVALASAVSVGNAHLVLFLDQDPGEIRVDRLGPALERHELFPDRTNVEFARVLSEGTIDVRVWERGVGETLACGSGACAVAATVDGTAPTGRRVTVRFRGGVLTVDRQEDGEMRLTGPVARVFEGRLDPSELTR